MTNVKSGKQYGPNQTAPDLDHHCLPLHIHKSEMQGTVNNLQQKDLVDAFCWRYMY